MARVLADDLDQTVSTPEKEVLTWHFAYGPEGAMKTYSIDLLAENFEKLEAALEPFTKVANTVTSAPSAPRTVRATRGTATTTSNRTVTQKGNTAQEVREWIRSNGKPDLAKSDRGRLSKEAIDFWNEATDHKDNQYTGA
jgi:hypothetical protein